MKASVICVAALLLAPTVSGAVDVVCPDGKRYFAGEPSKLPCVEVCDDGTWGVRGQIECPLPPLPTEIVRPKIKRWEHDEPDSEVPVGSLLAFVSSLCVMVLPWAIARVRKHHNLVAIGVTNLIGAAIPFVLVFGVLLGAGPSGSWNAATSSLVGGALLLGLAIGSPFWLGALIWSFTVVRRH